LLFIEHGGLVPLIRVLLFIWHLRFTGSKRLAKTGKNRHETGYFHDPSSCRKYFGKP